MTDLQLEKINKVKTVAQSQVSDIQKIAGINSLILSTCLIDTLAGFYCGYNRQKTGNKDRFLKFVDKYLVGHKAYLYDLRCNIVHSFSNTVANFMFIDDKNFTTVYGDIQQLLDWRIFNIDTFKNDLSSAVENYFNDLLDTNNNQLMTDFNTRFDSLNILGDAVFPAMKNSKGQYVFDINEFDTLPGTDLKFGHYDPIKGKK